MQSLATVAQTAAEYLPAPQSVQGALHVVVLKVPAKQAMHEPQLGPVYPALHWLKRVLTNDEVMFPGHDVQAVAPKEFDQVLTAQF
jgi:hypothetical protein